MQDEGPPYSSPSQCLVYFYEGNHAIPEALEGYMTLTAFNGLRSVSATRGGHALCARCREVVIPAMFGIDHCISCDREYKRALVFDKVVIRIGGAEVNIGRELGELLAYDEHRYRHLYHIKCVLFQRFSPFRILTCRYSDRPHCYISMWGGFVLPCDDTSTRIMRFL